MIVLGIKGCLLKIIPTLISTIAKPKGILLPGNETGKRNGATSTIQDNKPPCSPMSSKKSLNVIPSFGISKEILETVSEVLSFLSLIMAIGNLIVASYDLI